MKKNNKLFTFRIIIESEVGGGYHGFMPLLRGLHTYGDTLEEVKKNLKEAIICHLQGLKKAKEAIPQEENTFELVQTFSEKELISSR